VADALPLTQNAYKLLRAAVKSRLWSAGRSPGFESPGGPPGSPLRWPGGPRILFAI